MRDLGVCHDDRLLFDKHIDNIVSKASRALGFVMRSAKDFHQVKTFKILYCTFVRSYLEYASQVWSPRYQIYVSRIENIQKRFLKYLCFRTKVRYESTSYIDLCKKHHLLPLDKRRDISDLVFLLKIASGSVDCPELVSHIALRTPLKSRRFHPLLYLPGATSNFRQNTYLWRAASNFNAVSREVDIDLFNTGCATARKLLSERFFVSLFN